MSSTNNISELIESCGLLVDTVNDLKVNLSEIKSIQDKCDKKQKENNTQQEKNNKQAEITISKLETKEANILSLIDKAKEYEDKFSKILDNSETIMDYIESIKKENKMLKSEIDKLKKGSDSVLKDISEIKAVQSHAEEKPSQVNTGSSDQRSKTSRIITLNDYYFDEENVIIDEDGLRVSMFDTKALSNNLYIKMCGEYDETSDLNSLKAIRVFINEEKISDCLDVTIVDKNNEKFVSYFKIKKSILQGMDIGFDDILSIRFCLQIANEDNEDPFESTPFKADLYGEGIGYYDDNSYDIDFDDIDSIQSLYDNYIDKNHWLIVQKVAADGAKTDWSDNYCMVITETGESKANGICFLDGKYYKKSDPVKNDWKCFKIYDDQSALKIADYMDKNGYKRNY